MFRPTENNPNLSILPNAVSDIMPLQSRADDIVAAVLAVLLLLFLAYSQRLPKQGDYSTMYPLYKQR